ncbi:hypothetical protein ACHAXR_009820 [Thalassiosira sp. AJA248-18]
MMLLSSPSNNNNNNNNNPAAEAFASATLSIVNPNSKITPVVAVADDADAIKNNKVHKTRAYYRDSSGRARVHLRVRLEIPPAHPTTTTTTAINVDSNDDDGDNDGVAVVGGIGGGMEALLECGCIHPVPVESEAIVSSSSSADDDKKQEEDAQETTQEEEETTKKEEGDNLWQDELSTIGRNVKGEEIKSPWFTDTAFTFECCTTNNNGVASNSLSSDKKKSSSASNNNNNNKSTTITAAGGEAATSWALEGVTILHSQIERRSNDDDSPQDAKKKKKKAPISALLFDIEIAVGGDGILRSAGSSSREVLEEGELELRAVLRQKNKFRGKDDDYDNAAAVEEKIASSNNNNGAAAAAAAKLLLGGGTVGIAAGLLGLELGGCGALPPGTKKTLLRGGGGGMHHQQQQLQHNNINQQQITVQQQLHYDTKILRTSPPLRIHATLIPPLQLTVREVCGARAASGSTLVEITVEHSSRWHKEDVTVTGIAFHPGQSRLWDGTNNDYSGWGGGPGDDDDGLEEEKEGGGGGGGGGGEEDDDDDDDDGRESIFKNHNMNITTAASVTTANVIVSDGKSMQGGELSVIDMSRRVRWGFAPGSAPDLPLVLGPYEAFATVIQIDAGEDVRSRAFLSPISVNAMIGSSSSSSSVSSSKKKKTKKKNNSVDNNFVEEKKDHGERIMVTADARWTSSRVGVENSDAFRVDMSLRGGLETACRVGAPLVVSLRVLNLSMDPRDLMLLMAKDGEGRNSGLQWERPAEGRRRRTGSVGGNREQLLHQYSNNAVHTKENHSFNTAVVSEVNGYTFGVWGLSGDDDGTTRHHRDHELLAVDAALLLGEVKGQHSIEAELRFVPLREGTLDVPNLKLYDKRGMKWYNCVHTLKIVARQSNV